MTLPSPSSDSFSNCYSYMVGTRTCECVNFFATSSTRTLLSQCVKSGILSGRASRLRLFSFVTYNCNESVISFVFKCRLCSHFNIQQLMCKLFQTLFDESFISLYNFCYTSLPVLALGMFDQVRF